MPIRATATCPACGAAPGPILLHVPATPVTVSSVFETPEQARRVPNAEVALVACSVCELIFNASFDPKLAMIGARYESSQAASRRFGQFATELARDWVERHGLAGKAVLEIGCAQGGFLELMIEHGVARGIGFDPLVLPRDASDVADDRLELRSIAFDRSQLAVEASAAICRHTLEHIGDLKDFLENLLEWARRGRDRRVLIEVPAAERILAEGAFWDVYFEHCNYFTATSLQRVFEDAGFAVLGVRHVYGEQYLLLEAVAGDGSAARRGGAAASRSVDIGSQFAGRVEANRRAAASRLGARTDRRGLPVLWQGAAKAVGLLAGLPAGDWVDCAIDISPGRQGCFLPGSGLAIRSPGYLENMNPSVVVLMNEVYLDEVRRSLRAMRMDRRVVSINQLVAGITSTDV